MKLVKSQRGFYVPLILIKKLSLPNQVKNFKILKEENQQYKFKTNKIIVFKIIKKFNLKTQKIE